MQNITPEKKKGPSAANAQTPVQNGVDHTAEARRVVLGKISAQCPGNAVQTQQVKCLTALQILGSLSTIEARRGLDVLHPAARIKELNDSGLVRTVTLRKAEQTECGRVHHVGLYVVVREIRA